jgi:antirestriction protein ArdC
MTNDRARALAEQIENSVNALATETDAVRKSDVFRQWLNAMASFSSYSFNNQMLIAFQRPSASRVAGFRAWQKLGRHVVKGAKGIAILAPCAYRKKTEPDNEDSPSVKRLTGFKTAWVFAQEDTEGESLPTLTYAAPDGGEDLLSRLEWTTGEELGICLNYEEIIEHGVDGYSSGARIVVRTSLSPAAKCAVIVHEAAHELLHQGDKRVEAKAKTRSQRELEAEATAYVVMRHFGIEHVASNYLATYNVDGEQLKDSLETISSAAKRLIVAIEGNNTNTEATEMVASSEQEAYLAPA